MGLSNLQLPSLIATISFMVGGFIMANLILPFIETIIMQSETIKPLQANTDFEFRSLDTLFTEQAKKDAWWSYIKYLIMGSLFCLE